LKITLVASEWDYGDQGRGRSFEWYAFHETLRLDGHELSLFDAVAAQRSREATQRLLLEHVDAFAPDVVLCVLFKDEVTPSTLRIVRDEMGIPVVNWFCDDHWRYDEFSRRIAPSLTLSVTTSSAAAARYQRDGFPILHCQWGYADKVFGVPVRSGAPPARIVFVGQLYGKRSQLISSLSDGLGTSAAVDVYGFGSSNGRASAHEMIRLFAESAASLNFSSSWRPGLLGRLRRRQWRRVPTSLQLKARVFEVTGAGGLLLTEPSDDLELHFRPGQEVLVYRSAEELVELARQILDDLAGCEAIRRLGQARCLAEHTMSQRLSRVLEAALQ
jgi:spore maturation protein CgeB